MAEDILSAGIVAAKAGDRKNAQRLLARAVQTSPNSAEAWFWLGTVLDEPDRREYCFRRALALDPDYADAKEQLTREPRSGPPVPAPTDRTLVARQPSSPAGAESSPSAREVPQTVAPAIPADAATQPGDRQPEPPTAPHRAESRNPEPVPTPNPSGAPSGLEKILVALSGLVIGLLLCGGPPMFLIQTGRLDAVLQIAGVGPVRPASMPTPSATPRPSSTPTPTATNTLVLGASAYSPPAKYTAAEAKREFRSLFTQGRYSEAIQFLDRVIADGTNDSEAYYIRAVSYQRLMGNQRTLGEYDAYNKRALADLDKAIEMSPDIGDYYYARGDAYSNWSSIEEYRVDRDPLLEVALENYRMSAILGEQGDGSDVMIPVTLYALGRCNEVQVEAKRLNSPTGPGLNTMLALGNLCSGNSAAGLQQIETAIRSNPNNVRKFYRAILLFNAGRLNDALTQLNDILESSPDYNGYRYFLRALVYYDLKQPDRARADLITGSMNTWGRGELMAYVQGRLLIDAGDKARGIEQMRFAEATMTHEYGPLLGRIRKEIAQFGGAPAAPTLSVRIAKTPIPAPKVTPTKEIVPIPSNPVKVDLATGTGLLKIAPYSDQLISRFQASTPIKYKSVQSLTFRMVSKSAVSQPPLQLYLLNLIDHTWNSVNLVWGNNIIVKPDRYVGSQGEIYAALRNYSPDTITIDNAGFGLTVVKPDGTIATYGLK